MSGFNFGQIGNIISELFDSDLIDIKRDSGGTLKEVYSNVSCHIAYSSTDNPDPLSVDVKPIIQAINIHLPVWVDIQNNDFIVAKKMDSNGNLLRVYSGRCGNPVVSEGRQKVLMDMNSTESVEPTPIPPKNPVTIKVSYLSDGIPIQDFIEEKVEEGGSFSIKAPEIEGYSFSSCTVDGESQDSPLVYIPNVGEENHSVEFLYSVSDIPTFMRFLVNGIYTKDDGSLENGWHQYRKMDIDSIAREGDTFTITSDNVKFIHEDNGKTLEIKSGVKLVLIPGNIFVQVDSVTPVNEKIVFTAGEFSPSEAERASYVTGWYD